MDGPNIHGPANSPCAFIEKGDCQNGSTLTGCQKLNMSNIVNDVEPTSSPPKARQGVQKGSSGKAPRTQLATFFNILLNPVILNKGTVHHEA